MEEKQSSLAVLLIKTNYTALFLLGLAFFCYTIFGAKLAELAIQIAALDFPIFIGEILLGVIIILFLLKLLLFPLKFNKSLSSILILFFIFILSKAALGYREWGPLALRNAALFYYSFFAFLSYFFFDARLLKKQYIKFILLLILLAAILSKGITTASSCYAYLILLLAIFITFKNKVIRCSGILLALSLFLYLEAFNHTKALFVATVISSSYLFFISYLLIGNKIKNRRLHLVFFISLILVCFLVFVFSLKKSMMIRMRNAGNIANFIEKFCEIDEYITLNDIKDKDKDKDINVSLYEVKNSSSGPAQIGVYSYKVSLGAAKDKKGDVNKSIPKSNYLSARRKRTLLSAPVPKIEEIDSEEFKTLINNTDSNNMFWRVFAWRDALRDLISTNILFGVDFGKPFRSKSIEALHWDYGYGRVGWIEPHNSYVHILYRGGVVGLLFIIFIFGAFIKTSILFFKKHDYIGILTNSIILHWLFFAFFNVFLELPYYAIPFWILFGIVLALAYKRSV